MDLLISVVIPVLNVEDQLPEVLERLQAQTFPSDAFEILVVDNGSTDSTVSVARKFAVTVLEERRIKSPYAARNKGIQNSNGSIIGLLDANKIPEAGWIEKAVEAMEKEDADLLAGKVIFLFSSPPTIGEIYDSITYFDFENDLKKNRTAIGGNLFFRKVVWSEIGPFPADQRSGMDILWTQKAVDHGFKIIHRPEVLTHYQSRNLRAVLKKGFRVGTGHSKIWVEKELPSYRIFGRIIKGFFPPKFRQIKERIHRQGNNQFEHRSIELWIVEYLNSIIKSFGRMTGYFRIIFQNKGNSK